MSCGLIVTINTQIPVDKAAIHSIFQSERPSPNKTIHFRNADIKNSNVVLRVHIDDGAGSNALAVIKELDRLDQIKPTDSVLTSPTDSVLTSPTDSVLTSFNGTRVPVCGTITLEFLIGDNVESSAIFTVIDDVHTGELGDSFP